MVQATAIILAGGKNSRMGRNKAFLEIGWQRIIDRSVALFQGVFAEVMVVSNEPERYAYLGVPVVSDIIPGLGPLSGIHAGLTAASHEYSLVVACDMPFVDKDLATFLVDEARGFDVAVPKIGRYLQPLFAVYGSSCLETINTCLQQQISQILQLYSLVRVNYVCEDKIAAVADLKTVFVNVNTPAELEAARKIAGSLEKEKRLLKGLSLAPGGRVVENRA